MQSLNGRYGDFGGQYIPEILMAALQTLNEFWDKIKQDAEFQRQLNHLLNTYAGRPTPLTEIPRFAKQIDGPNIFLKREDLLHTGAHKINNALGQCLLAKQQGKTRVIAETGAGQHGVATAAACAHLDLACEIFMGSKDIQRQKPNVLRMQYLGAKVTPVPQGSATLKDAVNAALRDWSHSFQNTHYCLGSVLGPHPFPEMVATFQAIIGQECAEQCQQRFGTHPNTVLACVGGGSNAIGIFSGFLQDHSVQLIGVEAGGHGHQLGEHAARFYQNTPGVLHGCYTYLLQDMQGQIAPTASISAGLDYAAVGPQHAQLHKEGRVNYVAVQNKDVLRAFRCLAHTEGILCALESAHALAYVMQIASQIPKDHHIVINLSGRGDKDLPQLESLL